MQDFVNNLWRNNCKILTVGQAALNTQADVRVLDDAGNQTQIIHAVGPDKRMSEPSSLAYNTYMNSLKIAEKNNFKIIAFPFIATGIFGQSKKDIASYAVQATQDFISQNKTTNLQEIIFVIFDPKQEHNATALTEHQIFTHALSATQ